MEIEEDIDDFVTFHRVLGALTSGGWYFRGQANSEWQLLPRAGRPEYFLGNVINANLRDLGRFNEWRQRAVAYCSLPDNDLESLAIAQHHGLATRLLDWTTNPLIAMYFAVFEELQADGLIYCYSPCCFITEKHRDLTTETYLGLYKPRSITPRILNQSGAFTYHPFPAKPFNEYPQEFDGVESILARLTIRRKCKPALSRQLNLYGINEVTIFPDLDGLSRYINWGTRGIIEGRMEKSAEQIDVQET